MSHAPRMQVEDIHRLQTDPRFSSIELIPASTLVDALRAALGKVVDSPPQGKKKRARSRSGFAKAASDFEDSGDERWQEEEEDGY